MTVTETALAFLQDARRRGDACRPLDYGGSMLRASVEVDRAAMYPERLAAKLTAYARLHSYVPTVPGRRATFQQQGLEEWRRRHPLFPRLLVVLDGTGPAGI
ncbi:hypothetical protein ACIRJM_45365 [Streptomyces sp. NPDC102405]|uniref:hypothetical protein n=1 Tax=Streptomyces sp. NPDC102405 TaxID=3366170 RepID=UPI00381F5493